MFEQQGPRQIGVRTPDNYSTEQLPTRTLVHCIPLQMYGIAYGDDSGKAHISIAMKMGDEWYMPPNAEEWAGKVKPLASWLGKQCEAKSIATKDVSVPKSDTVDVMG